MSDVIVTHDVEQDRDSPGGPGCDCGQIYETKCPQCKEKLRLADDQWWEAKCECGRTWRLVISAEGTCES